MKSKNQNLLHCLKIVACILMSGVITFFVFFGGVALNETTRYNIWPLVLGLDLFYFAVSIINCVIGSVEIKKLSFMKSEMAASMMEDNKKNITEDIDKAYKKVFAKAIRNLVYSILYIILLTGLLFLNGYQVRVKDLDGFLGVCALLVLGMYWLLLYLILFSLFELIKKKNYLEVKEKGQIYELFDSIMKEVGMNQKISVDILPDSAECAVSSEKGVIKVSVGVFSLRILSKEELRAIFYHEIAHIMHRDVEKLGKVLKMVTVSTILTGGENIHLALYSATQFGLLYDLFMYKTFSSLHSEVSADEFASKQIDAKTYVEAIIKLHCFSYILALVAPESNQALSKEKKITNENFENSLNYYVKRYNSLLDKWDYISKNHLEERFTTHPNIRERRERYAKDCKLNLEITIYNDFDKEFACYIQNCNDLISDNSYIFEQEFEQNEKIYALAEERIQLEKDGLCDNDEIKLCNALDACMQLAKYDDALRIAQKILDMKQNQKFATYAMGYLKALYLFDDDCLFYLKDIVYGTLSTYSASAYEVLGNYIIAKGMEDERSRLRDYQYGLLDKVTQIEKIKMAPFNKAVKVEDPIFVEKVNQIFTENECVKAAYFWQRTVNDVTVRFVMVAIKYDKKVAENVHHLQYELDAVIRTSNDIYAVNFYNALADRNEVGGYKKYSIYKK
ncbi:MAG: M48 family metalloprotease [Bacilli bacterium]|nr:M48 family metalloprotease [Bacilli bacterium]